MRIKHSENPSAPLPPLWTKLDCIVWSSGLEQIKQPSINNHFLSLPFIFSLSKGKSPLSQAILLQITTCSSLDWFDLLLHSVSASVSANLLPSRIRSAGPHNQEARGGGGGLVFSSSLCFYCSCSICIQSSKSMEESQV